MDPIKSIPLLKKIDVFLFTSLDKFKTNPNYALIQDFYTGLEEEQQKVFKTLTVLFIFLIPIMLIAFLWWQNSNLRSDLNLRIEMVEKASEVIGNKQSLKLIIPDLISMNPIESAGMMNSRISNVLSSNGIDLSKVKVNNFSSSSISDNAYRAEADFAFTNFSTDELVNTFMGMIQNEKFRIQSLEAKRNGETNLLSGQFHAIHYSHLESLPEGQ